MYIKIPTEMLTDIYNLVSQIIENSDVNFHIFLRHVPDPLKDQFPNYVSIPNPRRQICDG